MIKISSTFTTFFTLGIYVTKFLALEVGGNVSFHILYIQVFWSGLFSKSVWIYISTFMYSMASSSTVFKILCFLVSWLNRRTEKLVLPWSNSLQNFLNIYFECAHFFLMFQLLNSCSLHIIVTNIFRIGGCRSISSLTHLSKVCGCVWVCTKQTFGWIEAHQLPSSSHPPLK